MKISKKNIEKRISEGSGMDLAILKDRIHTKLETEEKDCLYWKL